MITFDFRSTIIPFSLLEITHQFKKMKPGEVMEIICNDIGICSDLKSILPESICEIVLNETLNEGTDFRFQLRKKYS